MSPLTGSIFLYPSILSARASPPPPRSEEEDEAVKSGNFLGGTFSIRQQAKQRKEGMHGCKVRPRLTHSGGWMGRRGSHLGRPFSSGAKEPPTQPMPAQRIEDREGMGPRIARIQHMGTRAKHINRQLSSFSFPFAHVWRSEVGRWERRREGRRKGQNESLPRNFSSSPFSSSLCTRIERGK